MQPSLSSKKSEPLLEVLDDVVPADLHAAAWKACSGKHWYFGHGSHAGDWSRFWKMDLEGKGAFDSIWQHIRPRCEALAGGPLRVIRQYANGHTYGLGGQPHADDERPGSYTLLYYPMQEWNDGWDGETVFFDEHGEIAMAVRPRPNRAVVFDSRIPHAGRAPSRMCPALRVTVAYKLEIVAAAPSSPDPEISRDGARRGYRIRIPSGEVAQAVRERLAELSRTIRLPGFRPGKVPMTIIEKRYGAQARKEATNQVAAQAASRATPKGGVASAIELVSGREAGDVEFLLTVTYLPDLPLFDFSQLTLERLTATEANLQAAGLTSDDATALFRAHLKRQALDTLHAAYSFPLIPAIVEREFAGLWKTAEAQLGAVDAQERDALATEFRAIAERRVRLGLVVAEMARRHGIQSRQSAMLEDAVIDHFVAQAHVSERPATLEELRELIEE